MACATCNMIRGLLMAEGANSSSSGKEGQAESLRVL